VSASAPKFSLLLATLNEERRLPVLIESIRRQRYPRECVEIVIADGGSTDATVRIAREAGCAVYDNPVVRCEPGIAIALSKATGDLAVVMAADNPFHDEDFLTNLAKPFADPEIAAAFPMLVNTAEDSATTRYFNAFTDPFNHFLYGSAASPASYHRTYRIKKRTPDYVVYDFQAGPVPLIGLAQAFTLRLPYAKPEGTDEDDLVPVEMLIEAGKQIAYVPAALVEHHTVGGIGAALRKYAPRFRVRLRDPEQPLWQRSRGWNSGKRVRAYLWPFYSMSFVFPCFVSLYGLAVDRRIEWLYHPFVSAAFGYEFWKQFLTFVWQRVAGRK